MAVVGSTARCGEAVAPGPPPVTSSSPSPNTQPSAARLALVSTNGYEDSGYRVVAGEVTNISDASLDDVNVVVSWYTEWEDFVSTGEAPIGDPALLPGQTSAFEVRGPPFTQASTYTVLFTEIGGDTIPTEDWRGGLNRRSPDRPSSAPSAGRPG